MMTRIAKRRVELIGNHGGVLHSLRVTIAGILIVAIALSGIPKAFAGGSYPDGASMVSDAPRCVGTIVHQRFVISNTNYYNEDDYFSIAIEPAIGPTPVFELGTTFIPYGATIAIDITIPTQLAAGTNYSAFPVSGSVNDVIPNPFVVPDCHRLQIRGFVSDFESWVDPTKLPLVRLTIIATNSDGTPAVGATVKFSNSAASFTTTKNGMVSVVEKLTGPSGVSIQASLGGNQANTSVHIYNVTDTTQCRRDGEPNGLEGISNALDYMLPGAAGGLAILQNIWNAISLFRTAKGAIPEAKQTTVSARMFTGTFTTVYEADYSVTKSSDNSALVSENLFARNNTTVSNLYKMTTDPSMWNGWSCGTVA
jgi:hypothetical protein